eukprot:2491878-Rhodomonas_salina.1
MPLHTTLAVQHLGGKRRDLSHWWRIRIPKVAVRGRKQLLDRNSIVGSWSIRGGKWSGVGMWVTALNTRGSDVPFSADVLPDQAADLPALDVAHG